MTLSPSVEKMILILRQELKARGIKRRDVAARLGVSEITVKRYLSGKSVTLTTLEAMAQLVGLDLLSLATRAQEQSEPAPSLRKAQQAALGASRPLASVYILLVRGWPPAKIEKEFELGRDKLERLLNKLQDLGLIRRGAGQAIRVLVRPAPDQRGGDQLSDLWRELARQFLAEVDLRSERCEWFYNSVRLSPASIRRLRELMEQFLLEVRTLGRSDVALPSDEVKWYHLFIGAQPRKKISLLEQSW
jgi:transcriptional regulator with XRE-family HTH domain